jgi:alpha-ketoglutarate-dependent taurine dioxygenase
MHRRDAFDPNARRLMHRTQIKGDWLRSDAPAAAA